VLCYFAIVIIGVQKLVKLHRKNSKWTTTKYFVLSTLACSGLRTLTFVTLAILSRSETDAFVAHGDTSDEGRFYSDCLFVLTNMAVSFRL
jgi:hypothetical protein